MSASPERPVGAVTGHGDKPTNRPKVTQQVDSFLDDALGPIWVTCDYGGTGEGDVHLLNDGGVSCVNPVVVPGDAS